MLKICACFRSCVESLATWHQWRLNEAHVHRNSDLEHVNGIPGMAEFFDRASYGLGLYARELWTLFVEFVVITYQLKEKRHVRRQAFRSNMFNPFLLCYIDGIRAKRRVVQKHFDAVRAFLFQSGNRKSIQQSWKPARHCTIITGLLIRKQQSSATVSLRSGGKAVFGIKQDRARVRRENAAHMLLEFGDLLSRHFVRGQSGRFCEELAKRISLINR